MQDDIVRLLNAQDIDLEIDKLVRSRKEYPEQITILKGEIEDLENRIRELDERITNNKKNRGLLEEEISAEKELLDKKQKRLLETKSNKEYNAVQHEIEQARERIDNLETEEIELMTEMDELTPQREEAGQALGEKKEANLAKIDELQTRFDSIEADIDTLEMKKDRELSDVNARTLNVYKRLRKGKSGLAVAVIDQVKHSCRGCQKKLPPQKVMEARRANKLLFCENCGRILVWDDRENQQ